MFDAGLWKKRRKLLGVEKTIFGNTVGIWKILKFKYITREILQGDQKVLPTKILKFY